MRQRGRARATLYDFEVTTRLWAGAGISDCTEAGVDCMPGFGMFLVELVALGLFLIVWFVSVPIATVSILSVANTAGRRVAWLAVVWLVPVVGALAWYFRARSRVACDVDDGRPV
ncbi:hypothetical protein CRM89_29855 [Nocardia sp. FDAARGOS_372]|uniref:Cardiolipin synthase N-terminal domain-containing protein n=2 Tax=Nocardiaceae TaxID=85025 RepID=Q5YM62_NOCFA|nr:hypothetical protein CRM89_29855 [Nocardia sp. FDAARGOS_372]BAD60729.1 hypothetical protein PNF2_440 [Nocardia farcinica IFM 10152]